MGVGIFFLYEEFNHPSNKETKKKRTIGGGIAICKSSSYTQGMKRKKQRLT